MSSTPPTQPPVMVQQQQKSNSNMLVSNNIPTITLEQILHDVRTHTFFLDFLQKKQAEALLMFWTDCEQFKQLMGKSSEIESEAKKIINIHFSPNSKTSLFLGEVETNRVLNQMNNHGRPTLDMFYNAQRECVRQLKQNQFPAFLQSKSFKDMLQELKQIKTWTLLDAFRDPRRVRALHLILQVEKPEFVETLRFASDLKNRFKPLIAEGLIPSNDALAHKTPGKAATQKLRVVEELIELGKFLEKKYLSGESKQFAKGVSVTTAARVRISLDDCQHKLDLAKQHANTHQNTLPGSQGAFIAGRWVKNSNFEKTISATTGSTPGTTTNSLGQPAIPTSAVLEDTIKFLQEAFKQAEEEANAWLERYAMADARKTDYFLTPVIEPLSPNKSQYVEDVPNQDSILVLRLTSSELNFRLNGPHFLENTHEEEEGNEMKKSPPSPHHTLKDSIAHLLVLEPTHVSSKITKEEIPLLASDFTGATISSVSKGLKFRTKIKKHHTFSRAEGYKREKESVNNNNSASNTSLQEEELILQQARVTSLAGVPQQESVSENAARAKMLHSFDSFSLANTEFHAACFPLNLSIEVDAISFGNEPEHISFFHYFCLPCKTTRHSFEYGCTCLFGTCMTKIMKKDLLLPTTTSSSSSGNGEADKSSVLDRSVNSSLQLDSSTGSFSVRRQALKSPRNMAYVESTVLLPKVPQFGLGLNLALNRDGQVLVTRFVSDSSTPSPAAASGRIQVEDELLFVNRVSVHGRRFDDIVAQIKNASSPVHLRFAHGNYFESLLSQQGTEKIQARIVMDEEGKNSFLKFKVNYPKVVCMTSYEPIFEEMRNSLSALSESEQYSFFKEEEEEDEFFSIQAEQALLRIPNKMKPYWKALNVKENLFHFLSVPNIVDVLSAILLERRILIVSDHPERIAPAVLSFLQIIRPLSWKHDFSALLAESHYDFFTNKIGQTKPFLAGLCTVDVVPSRHDQFLPRRLGRLTFQEDIWSAKEKDFALPSERLSKNAGLVRGAITTLCSTGGTIIVDLDADKLTGNIESFIEKDKFPLDIREALVNDLNAGLGRGSRWKNSHHDDDEEEEEDDDDYVMIHQDENVSKVIHQAILRTLCTLSLDRVGEFALSLKEGVVGFYRAAFLGAIRNETHYDFLERFSKTETFKEFVTSNWDISSAAWKD